MDLYYIPTVIFSVSIGLTLIIMKYSIAQSNDNKGQDMNIRLIKNINNNLPK
jgi:hypothetical protein